MEDLRFRIGIYVFFRLSFGGFLRVHGVLGSLLNLETVEELAVALLALAAATRHLRKKVHAIVHHVAGHVKIGCLVGRLSAKPYFNPNRSLGKSFLSFSNDRH